LEIELEENCAYDSLKLYDGPSASSTLIETFCGDIDSLDEEEYTSTGSSMFVVFQSDRYINEGEFEFSWEKVMQADGQYDHRGSV